MCIFRVSYLTLGNQLVCSSLREKCLNLGTSESRERKMAVFKAGFSFLIQSKTLALAVVLPGVRAALKSSLETAPQTHQMWCFANALGVC